MTNPETIDRRSLLKALAALSSLSTMFGLASVTRADETGSAPGAASDELKMPEVPLSSGAKITVERRGQIVLIGINRPYIQNRIDPEAFVGLARAYYQYDRDPSLRAAVLFGHGDNFSRGIDVNAFQALVASGRPLISEDGTIDPLAKGKPKLSKPLVRGDSWGHLEHGP